MTLRSTAAAVGLLALAIASCGNGGGNGGTAESSGRDPAVATTSPPGGPAPRGEIVVLAAASLTAAFGEIGTAFSAAHPGVHVTFGFGASSELVTQITQGAPVDVFASADPANMTKLADAGLIAGRPATFATNELQIIVAPGNPKQIATVADLADRDLVVVTCSPEVPIGRYSAQVLANAGVSVTPKSLEANVKGIVTKVTTGEADAGIVYATDVRAAGDRAHGVSIPPEINVVAEYPIAVTRDAANPGLATELVDFVISADGRRILGTYGFGAP